MSLTEDETHMAMWCVMAAPLIVGCDLTKMSSDTVRILTAPGPLSVDQDPLGVQGTVCWASQDGSKSLQVWRKPLSDGSVAVVALNRGLPDASVDIPLAECGHGVSAEDGAITEVTDVWTGEVLANVTSGTTSYKSKVLLKHGHAFLKLSKQSVESETTSLRREHTRCMQSNSPIERMALVCPPDARISSLTSWWGAAASPGACLSEDGASVTDAVADRTAWISDGCLGKQACSFEAAATAAAETRLTVRFVCEQMH